jgi:hypothetical protein
MHGPGQTAASPLIWTGTGGLQQSTVPYRIFDHFIGELGPPWHVYYAAPLPVPQDIPRGVMKMPADGVGGCRIDTGHGMQFYRASNPIFEVSVLLDTILTDKKIGFEHFAGVNWAWGVSFDPALSPNWAIFNWNGGALIETPSTTAVVSGTWYTIRCWLTGAVGAQTVNMTINGGDLTQYNAAQPDAGVLCFCMFTDSAGGAGTGMYLDWIGIEANFGATPA